MIEDLDAPAYREDILAEVENAVEDLMLHGPGDDRQWSPLEAEGIEQALILIRGMK